MVRHIHQYGGTKISIRDDTTEQWKPTTDRKIISEKIMKNLVSLRTIAPDSKCSMVLLGNLNPNGDIRKRSQIYPDETGAQFAVEERADRPEYVERGKIETGVVMKISLVTYSPQVVKWRRVVKKTTTRKEIVREVKTQHTVAMRMLCGQKASDIIPDIFSDCFLTVDEFTTQLTVEPDDELTREIVEWIKTTARARECVIHIAFMDYVDGYDTFQEFYKTTQNNVELQLYTYQAVAVILTLLLKGRIMSFDFHHRNLLTNGSKVMCLDLGRIYDFSDNSSHILNYLIQLVMKKFIETRYFIEYNKHFEAEAKAVTEGNAVTETDDAAEAKAVTETDDAAEGNAAAEAKAVTEGNAAAEAKAVTEGNAAAEAPNAKKDAYRLEYRIAIKMGKNVDVASAQAKKVEDELDKTEKEAFKEIKLLYNLIYSEPELDARAWGLQTKGRSRTKVFNFFNVTNDTDLKTKFSIDFDRLLKKSDAEVYGFSSLSPDDNKRKFVYETLIFIAFIDGITNTCRYEVIDKSIQFSHVLRRVFHSINGDELFSNFDIFLSKFTIDYDEFCRLNPDLVVNMNIALDEISRRLADMLGACPSQHYHPSHFILPPDSSVLGEGEVVPLSRYGGSKRLRRRNSNKKRNHKSRNKQTRRRRRRNSTRRRVTRHH